MEFQHSFCCTGHETDDYYCCLGLACTCELCIEHCDGHGEHCGSECEKCEQTIAMAFICLDCSIDTINENYYMVHDDLWASVAQPEGMLCIACLEERLGRTLTAEDFTDCPLNTSKAQEPDLGLLYQRLNTPKSTAS